MDFLFGIKDFVFLGFNQVVVYLQYWDMEDLSKTLNMSWIMLRGWMKDGKGKL